MPKSLQEIEDYYSQKGLTGAALREATENDTEYRKIREEKYARLTQKFNVTDEEKAKYSLSTDQDYEILEMIHRLEAKSLSAEDAEIIEFVRTQLEDDWRTPIVEFLERMSKKYE